MNDMKALRIVAQRRAAETGRLREDCALIQQKIAAARQVLADADKQRQQHLVAAAKGDNAAIKAIDDVRRRSHAAEQEIADCEAVLPDLRRRIAEAEAVERNARLEVMECEADGAKRELVENSAEIDDLLAKLGRAIDRRDSLTDELEGYFIEKMNARGYGGMMVSNLEAARGEKRLLGAFQPRLVRRLLPSVILPDHMKLAELDAAFWQVQTMPDKSDEAA